MLVSVVVITYNSANFVLETLESIAAQTYQELELIVTDDASKDNTVALCREWIAQHKERFVCTQLLTVEKNTGIAGNCNRGYAAAKGEWIKGIAGDDILRQNCIEKCVSFATKYPEKIWLAYLQEFGDSNQVNKPKLKFETANAEKQLQIVLTNGLYIAAPSCFCKKDLWKNIGGFDEKYPLFEDLPFYVSVLLSGERIGIIPEIIVDYRVHGESVVRSGIISKDICSWYQDVLFPLQLKYGHFVAYWHQFLRLKKNNHQGGFIGKKCLSIVFTMIDPLQFIDCIRFFTKKFLRHIIDYKRSC